MFRSEDIYNFCIFDEFTNLNTSDTIIDITTHYYTLSTVSLEP